MLEQLTAQMWGAECDQKVVGNNDFAEATSICSSTNCLSPV